MRSDAELLEAWRGGQQDAGHALFQRYYDSVYRFLAGMIGPDATSGVHRFTFGITELADGAGFVSLAMGLFGICDIVNSLEKREKRDILRSKLTGFWLKKEELKAALPAMMRGTLCGSLLGILPGGGAIISSFTAYMIEKKSARDPEGFGKGDIRGVAAPESANNAAAQTSFVPLLTLGIPPNVGLAMMAGAMMIHGIQPGPRDPPGGVVRVVREDLLVERDGRLVSPILAEGAGEGIDLRTTV